MVPVSEESDTLFSESHVVNLSLVVSKIRFRPVIEMWLSS